MTATFLRMYHTVLSSLILMVTIVTYILFSQLCNSRTHCLEPFSRILAQGSIILIFDMPKKLVTMWLMYYGPILPQQKWPLANLLAGCRKTTPHAAVFYSGNLFTCIYSVCFLLSNELAFPKVGTFPGWCPGLEATFLGSECIDQCFYLITLIFLKIILALPSHCVCNFKFPCAVFFTKLHIFHTILFWIININKHRNQLPCNRVFVMLSWNFLWQIVSLLWFQPH